MLSYIGKKNYFAVKLRNSMQKSQEMGKIFVVSLFPVMIPLHPYQFNKNNSPLF